MQKKVYDCMQYELKYTNMLLFLAKFIKSAEFKLISIPSSGDVYLSLVDKSKFVNVLRTVGSHTLYLNSIRQ